MNSTIYEKYVSDCLPINEYLTSTIASKRSTEKKSLSKFSKFVIVKT